MDFCVIIINYNLTKEVQNCISSLIKLIDESDFEIILVDNNSDDESIVKIAEELSNNKKLKFSIIQTGKNIGFGNACNLAAKQSTGDVLFFLNPDIIIRENIFQSITNGSSDDVGDYYRGVWGLNVNEGRFMDFSAGYFPNYWFEALNVFSIGRYIEATYIKLKVIFSESKILKVRWVMGAAFFIGRNLFEMVNGFDPDFFLYFEEMDLCKRVIQRGFTVSYIANIKVEHIGSVSSKKNYYFFTKMFYKGKLLFLKKHSSVSGFYIYKKLLLLHILNQIIFWRLMKYKNKEKSFGKIKAFREILSNMNHPEKISNIP